MKEICDYFLCESCNGQEFEPVYTFSLRFHGVNFSDDLIYDKIIDHKYKCATCGKIFTGDQVENGLSEIRKNRKNTSL